MLPMADCCGRSSTGGRGSACRCDAPAASLWDFLVPHVLAASAAACWTPRFADLCCCGPPIPLGPAAPSASPFAGGSPPPLNALASIITDPTWQRSLNRKGELVATLAQQLAQAQAPHTDFLPVGPGMDDGLVFLLALQDFPLVAYMGSHKLSQLAAAHCWRTADGKKQVVEEDDMNHLALTLQHQLGTEVLVKAGQLVLFRGNTVHAGNVGVAGSCCARLYGFGRPDTVADNTTMNTSELGDLYHGLFQPIQGEDIGPIIADWN
ncbi:hypothetical protein QJQ45_010036 [Haematococcus lacustris]|nr:hypothetical protein QJQ45_010036 [Haematococcus lacustris]